MVHRWYRRYQEEGLVGLNDLSLRPGRFWNRITNIVRNQVVRFALEHPHKSPGQLAWRITDTKGNSA